MTTHGRIVGEASLTDVADGLTFTVKAEDGSPTNNAGRKYKEYGKIGADYVTSNFSFTSEVDVVNGPVVKASALTAYESVLLGGDVTYDTAMDESSGSPSLTDYNVGVAYQSSDFAATVKTAKKASIINVSYFQDYDKDTDVAATISYNTKDSDAKLIVGATMDFDSESSVAGKVDSTGIISLVYNQNLKNKIKLTSAAEIDAKNFDSDGHKFGMALTFG